VIKWSEADDSRAHEGVHVDPGDQPPISKSRRKMPPMTCCDPLAAECPLDLTEDDCRALIRLLHHAITPDWEPLLLRLEPLQVIL
jgi:hypothetical protein